MTPPKGPKIAKIQDLEIFKARLKISREPPTKPYLFVGSSEGQDWKFQARLKISSRIENFNRDWIFSIFGPLGPLGVRPIIILSGINFGIALYICSFPQIFLSAEIILLYITYLDRDPEVAPLSVFTTLHFKKRKQLLHYGYSKFGFAT